MTVFKFLKFISHGYLSSVSTLYLQYSMSVCFLDFVCTYLFFRVPVSVCSSLDLLRLFVFITCLLIWFSCVLVFILRLVIPFLLVFILWCVSLFLLSTCIYILPSSYCLHVFIFRLSVCSSRLLVFISRVSACSLSLSLSSSYVPPFYLSLLYLCVRACSSYLLVFIACSSCLVYISHMPVCSSYLCLPPNSSCLFLLSIQMLVVVISVLGSIV